MKTTIPPIDSSTFSDAKYSDNSRYTSEKSPQTLKFDFVNQTSTMRMSESDLNTDIIGADQVFVNHFNACVCSTCCSADFSSDGTAFESDFNTFGNSLKWAQPNDKGSPVTVTYSYTDLFDGGLNGDLSNAQAKDAIEEAFSVWAQYAPLNFVEIEDQGQKTGSNLDAADIRIGHDFLGGRGGTLGRTNLTTRPGELATTITFDNTEEWSLKSSGFTFDFLETALHEIGHALGLRHENSKQAIMNPSLKNRFSGLGTAFLLQDDINGIQSLYGRGKGAVKPLSGQPPVIPEPSSDPVQHPTPSPTPTSGAVNFNDVQITSYGGSSQDKALTTRTSSNGNGLTLEGNGWKKVSLPYTVTKNTIIEFDYKSNSEGDIQGIGFDTDDSLSKNRLFKLSGTQKWGISKFDTYDTGSGWKSYRIQVGDHITGKMKYLTFANDHDVKNPHASSQFRNIRIVEGQASPSPSPTPPTPDKPITGNSLEMHVSLNQKTTTSNLTSYGGSTQDVAPQVDISQNQKALKLEGNTWKKLAINYNVTPDTVMRMEFRSDAEGEIQGIGLDTDNSLSKNRLFKLTGTQKWGNAEFDDYVTNSGWKTYEIEVGDYFTGNMTYLTFANDHDVKNPKAVSEFRNIALFERTSGSLETLDQTQNITTLDGQQADVLSVAADTLL